MRSSRRTFSFSPPPGTAAVWIFRCAAEGDRRRRTPVGAVTPTSDVVEALKRAGPGRFRVEPRDARRIQLAGAVYADVAPDGRVRNAAPVQRARAFPSPVFVPGPRARAQAEGERAEASDETESGGCRTPDDAQE